MTNFQIDSTTLLDFLDEIREHAELIAPVQKQGELVWEAVTDVERISFLAGNPLSSPKQFFFPQSEELFQFRKGVYYYRTRRKQKKRVLFGVRPCDLAALEYSDRLFSSHQGGYEDIYYWSHRRNTFIVGINCLKLDENCFCFVCGTGPFAHKGYDLQLTPLGDCYLAEVGSPEGIDVVSAYSVFFSPATIDQEKKKETLRQEIEGKLSCKEIELQEVIRELAEDSSNGRVIKDEVWEEIALRCLDCGGCSYICPTCTCFTILDKLDMNIEGGKRWKIWDTCNLSGFTRMASGANPGANKRDRIKRRFLCKLLYSQQNQGVLGCVGCGRCSKVCYGGIDILKVACEIRANGNK